MGTEPHTFHKITGTVSISLITEPSPESPPEPVALCPQAPGLFRPA